MAKSSAEMTDELAALADELPKQITRELRSGLEEALGAVLPALSGPQETEVARLMDRAHYELGNFGEGDNPPATFEPSVEFKAGFLYAAMLVGDERFDY